MNKVNQRIWRERGLTEKGAEMAECVMLVLLRVADKCPAEVLKVVLEEAIFQKVDLPKRSISFQKANKWRRPLTKRDQRD